VNGTLLRSLRLARGWTQQEAARKSGMTERFIRKAETGQSLELKSLSLLAELYSTAAAPLTIEQLLTEPLLPLPLEEGRGEGGNFPLPPDPQVGAPGRGEGGLTVPPDDITAGAALLRRWFDEVWNHGRLETIDELTTADSVLHADGRVLRGSDAIRQRMEAIRAAFSHIDLNIEHVIVQEDWIVSRWRIAMTHTGPWMGSRPTRRRLEVRGSTWLRKEYGLFMEGWDFWEQQLATDALHDRRSRIARRKRGTGKRRKR
jgi:transcriptional regulator with XRE-family HTH domain